MTGKRHRRDASSAPRAPERNSGAYIRKASATYRVTSPAAHDAHQPGRKTSGQLVRVTVLGAGTARLDEQAARLGWILVTARTAAQLVEDSRRSTLSIIAIDAHTATRSMEALSKLREGGFTGPVVLLVDVDLQAMTGHPICAEARERGATLVLPQALSDAALLPILAEISGSMNPLPRAQPVVEYGEIRIAGNVAYRGGNPIPDLRSSEFRLLRLFLENPGRAFTAEEIAAFLSGGLLSPDTPKKHVSNLRKRMGDAEHRIIRWNEIGWGIGV